MNYVEDNVEGYDKAYDDGYGLQYPDGHIIRCYEYVLKYELGMDGSKGEKMLDFGCGSGTHCLYFKSKGFDVYGVDSSDVAIEKCKERMSDTPTHFQAVDGKPSADNDFFNTTFDLIISNQVLYFLSDTDYEQCITSLYNQLRPGGIIIATMKSTQDNCFDRSEEYGDGLRKVPFTGREAAIVPVSYFNFTASREELCDKFKNFKSLHIGHYSHSVIEEEGTAYHYIFIGQKDS